MKSFLFMGPSMLALSFCASTSACGSESTTDDSAGGGGGDGAAGASGQIGGGGAASIGGGGSGGGTRDVAPVELGDAGQFVILSKSGIDTIPGSVLTGDIGVSPIDSTGLTGFSLTLDAANTFSTSRQIIGRAYASDYAPPTPADLTVAVGDMEAAYTDAAGRTTPDFIDLGSGEIGGLTLAPGLYKWGSGVLVSTDVTLDGDASDVWIFQISGGITQASDTEVVLTGGALPENVFWQAAGAVALDTGAHLEGIVLSQTEVTLATGASVDGRLFSQTAVTLSGAVVTEP